MYIHTYICMCHSMYYLFIFLNPLLPKILTNQLPFSMTLIIINHNFRTLSTTLKYITKWVNLFLISFVIRFLMNHFETLMHWSAYAKYNFPIIITNADSGRCCLSIITCTFMWLLWETVACNLPHDCRRFNQLSLSWKQATQATEPGSNDLGLRLASCYGGGQNPH